MKNKSNSKKGIYYYHIQKPIAFSFKTYPRIVLNVEALEAQQQEITLKHTSTLVEGLRRQQAFFFEFIQASFLPLLEKGTMAYFCLDIPFSHKKQPYQLVRYFQFPEENRFRLFILDNTTLYQGEPFFPRIGEKQPNGSIKETEIHQDWRKEALEGYYKAMDSRKAPFNPRPSELLKLYFDRPGIKEKDIPKTMHISRLTVNNHKKKIGSKIKTLFGITLPDYGPSAAQYWREMGLTFPKIVQIKSPAVLYIIRIKLETILNAIDILSHTFLIG